MLAALGFASVDGVVLVARQERAHDADEGRVFENPRLDRGEDWTAAEAVLDAGVDQELARGIGGASVDVQGRLTAGDHAAAERHGLSCALLGRLGHPQLDGRAEHAHVCPDAKAVLGEVLFADGDNAFDGVGGDVLDRSADERDELDVEPVADHLVERGGDVGFGDVGVCIRTAPSEVIHSDGLSDVGALVGAADNEGDGVGAAEPVGCSGDMGGGEEVDLQLSTRIDVSDENAASGWRCVIGRADADERLGEIVVGGWGDELRLLRRGGGSGGLCVSLFRGSRKSAGHPHEAVEGEPAEPIAKT